MAMFDPKKARESANDDQRAKGLPASEYLLALIWFERKTGKKSGKDYLRACYTVISGAARGKKFYDSVSLDTTNSGAALRLGLWSEEVGVTEAFDLDDDAAIARALLNKPFKAKVNRKIENGYVNNGIERYCVGDKVSAGERTTMQEWVMVKAEEQEFEGGGQHFDEDAPPPGDDDVPF